MSWSRQNNSAGPVGAGALRAFRLPRELQAHTYRLDTGTYLLVRKAKLVLKDGLAVD